MEQQTDVEAIPTDPGHGNGKRALFSTSHLLNAIAL